MVEPKQFQIVVEQSESVQAELLLNVNNIIDTQACGKKLAKDIVENLAIRNYYNIEKDNSRMCTATVVINWVEGGVAVRKDTFNQREIIYYNSVDTLTAGIIFAVNKLANYYKIKTEQFITDDALKQALNSNGLFIDAAQCTGALNPNTGFFEEETDEAVVDTEVLYFIVNDEHYIESSLKENTDCESVVQDICETLQQADYMEKQDVPGTFKVVIDDIYIEETFWSYQDSHTRIVEVIENVYNRYIERKGARQIKEIMPGFMKAINKMAK